MLFHDAMCICCRMRTADIKYRRGGIGICGRCFSRMPKTSSTMSFSGEKYVDYVISPFYYAKHLRAAILAYKFNGAKAYAKVFAELLKDELEPIKYMLGGFDMLVPVPLSQRRMNERGYNQSALIAEPLAEFIGADYSPDALKRVKNTRRQSGLKNYERKSNVLGAFSAPDNVKGKSVIIFDDIYTTGSTVEECAKTLKGAGAGKIIALTLSITDRRLITPEARLF